MNTQPATERICELLCAHRFRFSGEKELQDGIAQVLTAAGVQFRREVRLDGRNRIDFLAGAIGIEVKINGSAISVFRQLSRYLQFDFISQLILVTTRARHGTDLDERVRIVRLDTFFA